MIGFKPAVAGGPTNAVAPWPGLGQGGARRRVRLTLLVATLALVVTAIPHLSALGSVSDLLAPTNAPAAPADATTRASVGAAMSAMPLSFVENQGQLAAPVAYYVQGSTTSVYFTPGGVTYALSDAASTDAPSPTAPGRWAVKLDFVGANAVAPVATDPAPGVVSYFTGGAAHTGVATFGGLTYHDVWPGVDMVWSGAGAKLEYSFVVHPGADPSRIALAYSGATDVALVDGQVKVTTPWGSFADDRPLTYQDVGGQRVEVPSGFALAPGAEAGTASFGIPVGAYDTTKDLIIDPVVLVYAGWIGGTGQDLGIGIDVDNGGAAYVTGWTFSSDFPAVAGPDPTYNGGMDAFVAKVNPAGTGLVYTGYIGGSGNDEGDGIAVDGAGNAYVTGATRSTEGTFPVTGGPDVTHNGEFDAFVAKLNPQGTALLYAGYLGGSNSDLAYGVDVDAGGNAYIAGVTYSSDFPAINGPDLTANGGNGDAFVAKVNASGTGVDYAGYIGGDGGDSGNDVAVDGAGNAYVTGTTGSSEATFPVINGPDLTSAGSGDAFVARVNAAGTALDYAGYIGGSDCGAGAIPLGLCGVDRGNGISVDSAGNAYVTGETASTEATFPVMVGPDLTWNGLTDAYVAKVDPAGAFVYVGYIGGASTDPSEDVAVDGAGNAYVTGWTSSRRNTFPAKDGPDLSYNGGFDGDAFVAEVNVGGTGLVYAGYIGGRQDERGKGIAVDSAGNAYVTGFTASKRLSRSATVGPISSYQGNFDAFVAKVGHTIG
jgi:hypothetical protein